MTNEEPQLSDHPLFRALTESGMTDGMDYLAVEMQNVARSEAPQLEVLRSMTKLRPLVDGGYITAEVVLRGLAYAVELSGLSEEELRDEEDRLEGERDA